MGEKKILSYKKENSFKQMCRYSPVQEVELDSSPLACGLDLLFHKEDTEEREE